MVIIPDIHGRDFWVQPVTEHFNSIGEDTNAFERKVIFLGDYLDPYGYEDIAFQTAVTRFEQIISLKKEYPNDIVLLLGNHDWAYIMPEKFCSSRHNFFYESKVKDLFWDNIDIFSMFYKCDIAGKHYVFSHAGLHPEWMMSYLGITDVNKVIEIYNHSPISPNFIDKLACISSLRKGHASVGSPIWCDVEEFDDAELDDSYYQIFGHTQQEKLPVITPKYACLDCRRVFNIDSSGNLNYYEKSSEELNL